MKKTLRSMIAASALAFSEPNQSDVNVDPYLTPTMDQETGKVTHLVNPNYFKPTENRQGNMRGFSKLLALATIVGASLLGGCSKRMYTEKEFSEFEVEANIQPLGRVQLIDVDHDQIVDGIASIPAINSVSDRALIYFAEGYKGKLPHSYGSEKQMSPELRESASVALKSIQSLGYITAKAQGQLATK